MRQGAIIAAGMVLGLASATGAAAQNYPERVVQIIVPATPGSSADILGRVLADGLSSQFGKPVIVVNKPGANGVLGTAAVARANPDGYMLMHGATYSVTVQPLTDKDAGYTLKSFTPICQTFKNDQVVVVPPNSPLKTAKDLIEAAKQKPGALNVGIPGIATIPHLAMIQLAQQAKVEFNVAPLSFGGLFGPAGMPADVTRKLESACIAIMKSDAAQRVVKNTFQPADYFADAAGFARNLATDVAEKTPLVALLKPQ